MPTFSYIARTAEGTLDKGTIDAANHEAAREKLRKKQLLVEELKEAHESKPIGFAGAMPWTTTDDAPKGKKKDTVVPMTMDEHDGYIPLIDTLRLFAGWLLAWYSVVYLLGSFRMNEKLPFELPFLQGLFESGIVLRFTFATFLFLMLTTIHRSLKGGIGKGLVLSLIGIIAFGLFYLNA
jgi:hypothetical protein